MTVADRGHVLSYLKGEYDGSDHIDLEFVPATSGVTRPASSTIGAFGGSSVGKSLAIGAEMSAAAASAAVLAAQRQETALRTRVTVLDAPGFKNFSDFVFDFFKRQEMASSSGAAAGAKGGKRGRDGAPAAAGAGVETKKARAGNC